MKINVISRKLSHRLLAVFLSVAVAAAAFFIFAYGFSALRRHTRGKTSLEFYKDGYRISGFGQAVAVLGYTIQPSASIIAEKKIKGKTLYRVTYTMDSLSRRITPLEGERKKSDFCVFFGCSYTFGEGVLENETLPYYFGRCAADVRPYNYGCIGYGTQSMLALLQTRDLANEIAEKRGIAVYVFMDDHVRRVIGSVNVCRKWGSQMPCYTVDRNGLLTRRGSFAEVYPGRMRFCAMVNNNSLLDTFISKVDLPFVTENDIRLTGRIIQESQARFRESFPNSGFYVMFFPGSKYAARLIPYLKDSGIEYFDYSALVDMNGRGCRLSDAAYDRHPSAKVYRLVARELYRDLQGRTGSPRKSGTRRTL